MKIKKYSYSIIAFLLVICLSILSLPSFAITAAAQDIDYTAENRARDFLLSVYGAKELYYDEMSTLYSVELYDDEDEVIAQASIFDRDGKIDYAIYNYITESIDEYGFDCPDVLNDFPAEGKTYYAGVFNYYSSVSNMFVINFSGETVTQSQLHNKIRDFKGKAHERRDSKFGNSSKPGNGSNGIIDWKEIKENRTSGWENSDWGYLDGITWGSTTDTNGISGDGLSFSTMNSFSNGGAITNHCGPTALTNIMVYYDWLGMDTLLNGSRQDTFNRLRTLCKHDQNNTTYMSDARSALKTYMSEMGYSVSLTNFNNNFDKYKKAIDDDKIVLTLLNVTESDGDSWGHFVVTLGYEEFRQSYEKQVLWWTVTDYNYLRYIRVCDGWGSCNNNRYVDLNNFYDSYTNSAITIN